MKRGLMLIIIVAIFMFFLFASYGVNAEYEVNKSIAFKWLQNRTSDKGWPRSLATEQFVFSFLALEKQISDSSKQAALTNFTKKGTGKCWPAPEATCTIKETALAKLMLDAAAASTETVDEWLLNKTISYPIDWYLQLVSADSVDMECVLVYDNAEKRINVSKEGKITIALGDLSDCFVLEEPYYWLKLKSVCSNKTINISCNKDFKVSYIFRKNDVWYVSAVSYQENGIWRISGEAQLARATGVLSIKPIATYCLGNAICDYEATAWTAYAFAKTGETGKEKIMSLIPYLVMEKENNKKFLPEAFLCSIGLKCSELAAKQQTTNGLWLAPSSAYNEFYDSALAGIMSQQQAGNWSKAEKTLFLRQRKDGSWAASSNPSPIRDTAMILYAMQAGELVECIREGYSCVINCSAINGIKQSFKCPTGLECCKIGREEECEMRGGGCKTSCATNEFVVNYSCEGNLKCCKSAGMSNCSELNGNKCSAGQKCVKEGFVVPFVSTVDSASCCLADCVTPTKSCSELNGVVCKTSEGKSCENGKWLPSTDDQCCQADSCKLGLLTCSEIKGELCEEGQRCKNGKLIIASDTANKELCCVEGGSCVLAQCTGEVCATNEGCNGTLVPAEDVDKCCIDGVCLKSCSALNGVSCRPPKVCKEPIPRTDNLYCCKPNKCVEKKGFPLWLLFVLIIVALALVLFLFMRKKKKKEKPKVVMPTTMWPLRRIARPRIFRRAAVPAPAPAGKLMPKLKPAFPLKPKPAEKKKAVLEELEKLSKE